MTLPPLILVHLSSWDKVKEWEGWVTDVCSEYRPADLNALNREDLDYWIPRQRLVWWRNMIERNARAA